MENLGTIRHNWAKAEIRELFEKPFMDLLFIAHTIHRQNFNPNEIQHSILLSIKTGACPEDCGYCSQSGHHKTGLEKERLMDVNAVVDLAKQAKANGASRFCMGAAWRSPPEKQFGKILEMITEVRKLGLETCMTLGMLNEEQAKQLREAGLDYYNHNIDTSPEHYPNVTSTRTFQDRLDTLKCVQDSGVKVCCGGIMGMGETREDRISFLMTLANLEQHPGSVPVNRLSPIPGTPLGNSKPIENLEFIRTIACARITMPKSLVRLSAGRADMSDEMQALCFFAGANSIHMGGKLLTTKSPELDQDTQLLKRLGLTPLVMPGEEESLTC